MNPQTLSPAFQQTRHARRIYVGGIPPNYADEEALKFFINSVIAKGMGVENDNSYVLSMYLNQKKCFAFVELKSIELATACLDMDGIIYKKVILKVLRANEYKPELIPPSVMREPIIFDLTSFAFGSPVVPAATNNIYGGGGSSSMSSDAYQPQGDMNQHHMLSPSQTHRSQQQHQTNFQNQQQPAHFGKNQNQNQHTHHPQAHAQVQPPALYPQAHPMGGQNAHFIARPQSVSPTPLPQHPSIFTVAGADVEDEEPAASETRLDSIIYSAAVGEVQFGSLVLVGYDGNHTQNSGDMNSASQHHHHHNHLGQHIVNTDSHISGVTSHGMSSASGGAVGGGAGSAANNAVAAPHSGGLMKSRGIASRGIAVNSSGSASISSISILNNAHNNGNSQKAGLGIMNENAKVSAVKTLRNALKNSRFGVVDNPEFEISLSKTEENNNSKTRICDLGDIPPGVFAEDSRNILSSAISQILLRGGIPFVVGGKSSQGDSSTAVAQSVLSCVPESVGVGVVTVSAQLGEPKAILDDPRFCRVSVVSGGADTAAAAAGTSATTKATTVSQAPSVTAVLEAKRLHQGSTNQQYPRTDGEECDAIMADLNASFDSCHVAASESGEEGMLVLDSVDEGDIMLDKGSVKNCDGKYIRFAAQGSQCSTETATYIKDRGGHIVWLTKDIRGRRELLPCADLKPGSVVAASSVGEKQLQLEKKHPLLWREDGEGQYISHATYLFDQALKMAAMGRTAFTTPAVESPTSVDTVSDASAADTAVVSIGAEDTIKDEAATGDKEPAQRADAVESSLDDFVFPTLMMANTRSSSTIGLDDAPTPDSSTMNMREGLATSSITPVSLTINVSNDDVDALNSNTNSGSTRNKMGLRIAPPDTYDSLTCYSADDNYISASTAAKDDDDDARLKELELLKQVKTTPVIVSLDLNCLARNVNEHHNLLSMFRSTNSSLTGLTVDEMLEMAMIAGRNENVSAFEVTDFDNSVDSNHSLLLSEIFYRFSLGHAQRKSESAVHPFIASAAKAYAVTSAAQPFMNNTASFGANMNGFGASEYNSHDNSMENMYYGSNNFINYAPGMNSAQITPTNAQQLVNQKSPTAAAATTSGPGISRFFASSSSSYGHEDLNHNAHQSAAQIHGPQGLTNPHLSAYQQQQLSQSLSHSHSSQGSVMSPKNLHNINNNSQTGKPPAPQLTQQTLAQSNHNRVPSLSRQVGHNIGPVAPGNHQQPQQQAPKPFSPTAAHQHSMGQHQVNDPYSAYQNQQQQQQQQQHSGGNNSGNKDSTTKHLHGRSLSDNTMGALAHSTSFRLTHNQTNNFSLQHNNHSTSQYMILQQLQAQQQMQMDNYTYGQAATNSVGNTPFGTVGGSSQSPRSPVPSGPSMLGRGNSTALPFMHTQQSQRVGGNSGLNTLQQTQQFQGSNLTQGFAGDAGSGQSPTAGDQRQQMPAPLQQTNSGGLSVRTVSFPLTLPQNSFLLSSQQQQQMLSQRDNSSSNLRSLGNSNLTTPRLPQSASMFNFDEPILGNTLTNNNNNSNTNSVSLNYSNNTSRTNNSQNENQQNQSGQPPQLKLPQPPASYLDYNMPLNAQNLNALNNGSLQTNQQQQQQPPSNSINSPPFLGLSSSVLNLHNATQAHNQAQHQHAVKHNALYRTQSSLSVISQSEIHDFDESLDLFDHPVSVSQSVPSVQRRSNLVGSLGGSTRNLTQTVQQQQQQQAHNHPHQNQQQQQQQQAALASLAHVPTSPANSSVGGNSISHCEHMIWNLN